MIFLAFPSSTDLAVVTTVWREIVSALQQVFGITSAAVGLHLQRNPIRIRIPTECPFHVFNHLPVSGVSFAFQQ